MKKNVAIMLAVASTGLLFTSFIVLHNNFVAPSEKQLLSFIPPILNINAADQITFRLPDPNDGIEQLLREKGTGLNPAVINKVLLTLKCSNVYHVDHNHILTVIDYSLPSSMKRLWVFDLNTKKLLFHTYVSHGIKSGTLLSNAFSNKYNSRASSIGVYKTDKAYYGREGLSLRLDGIDRSFNDNASNRAVVMHGGWYVNEYFIKRYGRAGRSWGCPALPLTHYENIINTIKDNSLFVVYYPSELWFAKSKFLTCTQQNIVHVTKQEDLSPKNNEDASREFVLFASTNHKNTRLEESAPILAVSADSYERIFQTKPPLARMLRRQINHAEYIALSTDEFKHLIERDIKTAINDIHFILPTIQMSHGYPETVMKFVNLGRIKDINMNMPGIGKQNTSYVVHFESNSAISLISTNRFIRWLGL